MRLIDADALIEKYIVVIRKTADEKLKTEIAVLLKDIEEQPTIDAIPLDGSFLKMSKSDYLIYDRHWLYEHFDQEIEIQRSAMKSIGYEYVGKNTDAIHHGKWANDAMDVLRCSECNTQAPWKYGRDYIDYRWKANYCPNCGARMDEDERIHCGIYCSG